MKNNESQRVFFIEICIAVIFFLMIAVTCFMSFTKSKMIQTESDNKILYANAAENAAEAFLAAPDIENTYDIFSHEFEGVETSQGYIKCQINGMDATVDMQVKDNLITGIITIMQKDMPVYQLSVSKAVNGGDTE